MAAEGANSFLACVPGRIDRSGDCESIFSCRRVFLIKHNQTLRLMMTILMILLGLACFWLLYRLINVFEKI